MSGTATDLESACAFCSVVAGAVRASIVFEDAHVMAFMDLRQFHPGHVLVIPRQHVADIRQADNAIAEAIMVAVMRIARAVDRAFPNDGLSVWHSAGPGANQEVPHLHFHVHPRMLGDDVLRVYPSSPANPDFATLDLWATRVQSALDETHPEPDNR